MSNSSIMSVREMIDSTFGETDRNSVNFKLMQTILYILARQLRVLERRVEVEIDHGLEVVSSGSISITEVKMHAVTPKKKKKAMGSTSGVDKEGTKAKGKIHPRKDGAHDTSVTSGMPQSSDKVNMDKFSFKSSDKKAVGKSSPDKSLSKSSDKKSSDKSSSEKSSEKPSTKSTSDKSSSDKTSIGKPSKKSPVKRTLDVISSDSSIAAKKVDFYNLLEIIEEQKERELRVINQRADSYEEPDEAPKPMVSIESLDVQQEKLLIVERVPAEETSGRSRNAARDRIPKLSIVTQEQFSTLAAIVRGLQAQFRQTGTPDFPDNIQLMQELRKGASLTDAMAALQLSARLDAAEKTLQQLMSLVTDLASRTPNIDLSGTIEELEIGAQAAISTYGAPGKSSQIPPPITRKSTAFQQPPPRGSRSITAHSAPSKSSSDESVQISMVQSMAAAEEPLLENYEQKHKERSNCVALNELDDAMQELYDEILKTVTNMTTRSNVNADTALQTAKRLEGRLEASLNLGNRMEDLETLVSEYAEQVNILDTGLSSQMTNYQEQLTQMQHDLETGLETMAEALANTGGDTTAISELNSNFSCLQIDLDNTNMRQRELRDIQNQLSLDLDDLRRQIEILRATKSDREEVADALRDKAGIAALNGLVNQQQFNAVRGNFEKRIGSAYDKFNNQEIIWQKVIDELFRNLNEKADCIQVVSLRDAITKNLEKLRDKIQAMFEIVGEPRAAAVTRKLHRDSECLSCSSPAHMNLEEPVTIPALPHFPSSRPAAIGAEAPSKPKDDGDHGVCYPGLPIPHARDARSHICHRYCGGSHTVLPNKPSRVPASMVITPAMRQVTTGVGSDGKTYVMDVLLTKKPCVPCNMPKPTTPQPSEQGFEQVLEHNETIYDMTPPDFHMLSNQMMTTEDSSPSVTPPPPTDD